MAQGKPTPGDSGKRPPKTSTRVQGSTRAGVGNGTNNGVTNGPNGNGNGNGRNGGRAQDEMEGLFVDPAPDSKRSSRAADRRRERGQAPQGPGQPDTRASLPAREGREGRDGRDGRERDRDRASQVSELNPKAFAKAHLQCTRGPEEGLSLQLIEGSYTIGRARENSFVLKDIAASRRHLRIDVDGRGARVVDLGSGNGTRVNGKRIAEHELKHGDRIEIGGSVLQFVEKGGASLNAGGGGPSMGDPAGVDDAQERVIRAAEKLAAELSQRMRFEDGSQSDFEDGHVAKTQAIPKQAKDKLTEEIKRQQQAQQNAGAPPQKAEKLWKETFTNLPLNQVVAADEPLRGPRAAESAQPPLQPVAVQTRNPLPRPQPLPMPPMPEDELDLSSSTSRGGSFVMSLLVTTLVVVLGGGLVITFYALTRNRSNDSGITEQAAREEYERAMEKCREAFTAGDWMRSYEYANVALQMVPNDPVAKTYQKDARDRIDAATRGGAPPPSPTGTPITNPPTAPPGQPGQPAQPPTGAETAPAPVGVVAVGAGAQPPPAPVATPPQQPAPREVAPRPRPPPREAAPPRESAPRPKPKPPGRGNTMSDATAQAKFSDAVDALRDKDAKKGCRLLEEIADKAPVDSRWKEKAENLYSRRCAE